MQLTTGPTAREPRVGETAIGAVEVAIGGRRDHEGIVRGVGFEQAVHVVGQTGSAGPPCAA